MLRGALGFATTGRKPNEPAAPTRDPILASSDPDQSKRMAAVWLAGSRSCRPLAWERQAGVVVAAVMATAEARNGALASRS
jgi:hypothetical protein